jgi:regulatory protein
MPLKKKWKRRSANSNDFTNKTEPSRPSSEAELLEFALKALTRHPHTIAELKALLLKRSPDEPLVRDIIRKLTDCGYLDDRKLAQSSVQFAVERKLQGRLRIEKELTERGVAPKLIGTVLEEQFPISQESRQLSLALERKLAALAPPLDAKKLSRLYNHLVRQGFSEEAIRLEMARRFRDGLDFLQ